MMKYKAKKYAVKVFTCGSPPSSPTQTSITLRAHSIIPPQRSCAGTNHDFRRPKEGKYRESTWPSKVVISRTQTKFV